MDKNIGEDKIEEKNNINKIEKENKLSISEKISLQKSKERDGLRRLVEGRFAGNMTTCARAARVSTSTVSRVINGETRMGGRLLRGIIGYLERNNLQYSDYFSFN